MNQVQFDISSKGLDSCNVADDDDWYPGDDVLDVVGADVYEPRGSTMDSSWESLKLRYEGEKLITLSETGSFVVPSAMHAYRTMWSWANSWDISAYNITAADIHAFYHDPDVLTRDQLPKSWHTK